VEHGLAYPCFCTEEELRSLRERQESQKLTPGYYGEFALCRNLQAEEAIGKINAGSPYVVRLRSPGRLEKKVIFEDGIKGKIEMPENTADIVLLKTDGIPTYHFAHAVDDHLMRTTHVIRGDEWISSVPVHLQLFSVLGFKSPKYAHISPLMKEENDGIQSDSKPGGSREQKTRPNSHSAAGVKKRKLSKRKDPEAAVKYYAEQGFSAETVTEYLLTVANSGFEDWRRQNPLEPLENYPFALKKMSVSGALFDLDKLNDVGKTVISRRSAQEVTAGVLAWANQYDPEFFALLDRDREYAQSIFAIDRGGAKPRKDLAKYSDSRQFSAYFFDELWGGEYDWDEKISREKRADILRKYTEIYNPEDNREAWFAKIKELCPQLGFCPDVKQYKENPEGFAGHVGDLTTVIRVAVTGRRNTPDLCEIMRLLGKDRVNIRLAKAQNPYGQVSCPITAPAKVNKCKQLRIES
jgi:glutamyl-tRNA synthetase